MYFRNNNEDTESSTGKHRATGPREESYSNEKDWLEDQDSEANTSSGIGGTTSSSSVVFLNPSFSSYTGQESSGSIDEAPSDGVIGGEEMELERSDHAEVARDETNQQPVNPAALGSSAGQGQTKLAERVPRKKGVSKAQTTRSKTSSTRSNSSDEEVIISQPFDVLLGRGKKHRRQPGNIRMHQIVNNYRDFYLNSTTRRDKAVLTEKIVHFIKHQSGDKNGRFLRHDPVKRGWVEVSDENARHKIGHALRDKPRYTWLEGINIGYSVGGRDESQSFTTAATATDGQDDDEDHIKLAGVVTANISEPIQQECDKESESDEKEDTKEEQGESTSNYVETSDWLPRGWFDGPSHSSFGPGRSKIAFEKE